ncbi:MAG: maleylpyruvate isomerase N-terminal domain-containing protein [Propionibacteriaceae bacterium]|nr:maleylpyruvate isomerase N-terminal domain-containing protein [Propionibacteriaceae bacterium]
MKRTFARAAAAFSQLVNRLPDDRWADPGLGDWDLRSLVGHASRSLITVDTYLDRPADTEQLMSPHDYYLATAAAAGADPTAVAERGRQAGLALGDHAAETVSVLARRVVPRVEAAGDPLIETIAGGMRLSNYLPTRTFELVVHSLDIAAAAAVDAPAFDEDLLAEVATLAARIAVSQGRGVELILAMTGRRRLGDGFSVV